MKRRRTPLRLPSPRASITAWLFALVLLAVVVAVAVHFSELRELTRVLRSIKPLWLLSAAGLQGATYLCAAGVWRLALVHERRHLRIGTLCRMALLMLFTNQAFPTAGLSGGAVVVRALRKRRVPTNVAMGALLLGVMTTYIAYVGAILISLVWLHVHYGISLRWLAVAGILAVLALAMPTVVVWYRTSIAPHLRKRLKKVPGLATLLDAVAHSPTRLLHDWTVLGRAVMLQFGELALDAATLQVVLVAIGVHASPLAVFCCYAISATMSQLAAVPTGLGSFEGAMVAMLHLVGVSVEAALTATLLLRTFTFWLPMIPGVWLTHQELSPRRRYRVRRPAALALAK